MQDDLKALRDWAKRLDAWLWESSNDDRQTIFSRLVKLNYRPDEFANDAMVRLLARFDGTVREIKLALRDADDRYDELCCLLPANNCPDCGGTAYTEPHEEIGGHLTRCVDCDWFSWLRDEKSRHVMDGEKRLAESCDRLRRAISAGCDGMEAALTTIHNRTKSARDKRDSNYQQQGGKPPGRPAADPVTVKQLATLLHLEPKTVQNKKPPEEAVLGKDGRGIKTLSYSRVRPWLIEQWPEGESSLPDDYQEAKKLF